MAVDPHALAALIHRARGACADIATVRAETLQILAETRRLLTGAQSATAPIAPSPRTITAATAGHLQRNDQERRESDRLEAQLAAAKATARAVAHALNQPLAVIRGVSELIQSAPPGELYTPDLAVILSATDRAAAVIRDLMRLAHYTTQPTADGSPMLDMSTAIDPPALLE